MGTSDPSSTLTSQLAVTTTTYPSNHQGSTMRVLIFVALAVAVSADYHDDVFHFSTLGSSSGLKKTAFLQAGPSAALTKKTFSSSAVLAKSIEQEIPLFSQQIAQPAFAQQYSKYTVQQAAQPAFAQQYSKYTVQQAAQPAFAQQYSKYTVQQAAQPAFAQQYTVQQPAVFAQANFAAAPAPAFAQQYTASAQQYAASAPQYRILSQIQETDPSGPYKLSYSTENGIQVQEEGSLIPGAEGPVVAAQGSYSYTGPDGVQYTVSYIADENGFRASGDHLPTPPPIPAEILKSLEENAASGERYDDQGRLLQK